MVRNLRRSRRSAPKANQTADYSVNDIVEVPRGSAIVKARLVELLTDASASNPRWLIKYEGLSLKDEEVYENAFAKPKDDSDDSDSDLDYSSYQRNRRLGIDVNNSRRSNNESENGDSRKRRATSRAARSRNRQAKIDEETSGSSNKRRILPPPPRNRGGKRGRPSNRNGNNHHNDDDNDVVKVTMLTGTLYLYRGLHRRAEFVRKV